jgi:hypothetical protein
MADDGNQENPLIQFKAMFDYIIFTFKSLNGFDESITFESFEKIAREGQEPEFATEGTDQEQQNILGAATTYLTGRVEAFTQKSLEDSNTIGFVNRGFINPQARNDFIKSSIFYNLHAYVKHFEKKFVDIPNPLVTADLWRQVKDEALEKIGKGGYTLDTQPLKVRYMRDTKDITMNLELDFEGYEAQLAAAP